MPFRRTPRNPAPPPPPNLPAARTWRLLDVAARGAAEAAFPLPSAADRAGLRLGDWARVVFQTPGDGTSDVMWIQVTSVATDGPRYRGLLRNTPVAPRPDLRPGMVVDFSPDHVCEIDRAP